MKLARKPLLFTLLAVVVGGYLINSACERLYFKPLARESQLEITLNKKISDTRLRIKRLQKKIEQRDELRARALPENIELASSLYQSWLITLVTSLGVVNPMVDSISPIAENDLTRLQFTVRGKANLKQFCQLLFEFYRAGHLHKIRQISLTPTGGSEQMDLSMTVEAISLVNSTNETALTTLPSQRLVSDRLEDYVSISRRNIFGKGLLSPVIRSTRLTAITSDRQGKRESWFFVPQKSETHYLQEGDIVNIDSLQLKVVEIHQDSVEFEIDGNPGLLEVGKTIADMRADQEAPLQE